jgi:uncharacterized protein HemY
MRRLILVLVLVPLAVVVIVLSVANRHLVRLSIDPFGGETSSLSVAAPLFVILFAALAIGIIVGGIATWLRQGHWRKLARRERAELDRVGGNGERRRDAAPAGAGANALVPARREAG